MDTRLPVRAHTLCRLSLFCYPFLFLDATQDATEPSCHQRLLRPGQVLRPPLFLRTLSALSKTGRVSWAVPLSGCVCHFCHGYPGALGFAEEDHTGKSTILIARDGLLTLIFQGSLTLGIKIFSKTPVLWKFSFC